MKIKINALNEYRFYPDLGVEQHGEKFCVVLKRLSATIHSSRWADFNADTGAVSIDMARRVAAHIVRLENAPELELPDGTARGMVAEDLTNGEYPELFNILEQVNNEINRLDELSGSYEVKN